MLIKFLCSLLLSVFMGINLHPIFSQTSSKEKIPTATVIISQVIQNKYRLTPKLQTIFWTEFSHLKPITEQKQTALKNGMIGPSITLLYYFYKDALISVYIKEPYKSELRSQYEKTLQKLGVLSNKTIAQHEMFQQKLISRAISESKLSDDKKTPLTIKSIEKFIKELSSTQKRLDYLFTAPTKFTH